MVSGYRIARAGVLTLLLVMLLHPAAFADTHVLGITYLPMTSCDEVWNWNGCPSKMTQTLFQDPGGFGHCYWTQPSGRIRMYPARLEVDLSSMAGIEQIQVDILETEYAGRTKAYAYAHGSSTAFAQAASTGSGLQTLVVDVTANRPVKLGVACANCEVSEVRLVASGTIVPIDLNNFGAIKARYSK